MASEHHESPVTGQPRERDKVQHICIKIKMDGICSVTIGISAGLASKNVLLIFLRVQTAYQEFLVKI